MRRSSVQARIAFEVSSVLSERTAAGLPHQAMMRSSSRATRAPRSTCRDQTKAFARAVVDDDKHTEAASIGHLVVDEIERPAGVRTIRHRHRRSEPQGALATAALPLHQPLLAIDPLHPLPGHGPALAAQKHVLAPIAKATALIRQCP